MTAADTCAALAAHGINLVDEDDAGSILLGLLEKVAHAGGTHAHEHLYEIRAADGEKGHPCLTGHRAGQQGLACARRAKEQHALGNPCSQIGKLLLVLEELHHFLQFLLGLVSPGHILEGDLDLVGPAHAGTALAEGHDPAAASLGLLHDEEPDANEKQNRQDRREHSGPPGRLRRIVRRDVHAFGGEPFVKMRVAVRLIRRDSGEFRPVRERPVDSILDKGDLLHLPCIHLMQELGVFHRLADSLLGGEVVNDGNSHKNDQQVKAYVA